MTPQTGVSPDSFVVLGGGLAGLSAAYALAKAGQRVNVFESGPEPGGLSRTLVRGQFRFDIGGHRFFTRDRAVEDFVRSLMGDELLSVGRKSQIFLRGRFFDYPLKPLNSLSGLGAGTVAAVMGDYAIERAKGLFGSKECVSLEDWVVSNFGRKMFDIYFKQYSEKVWGIPCDRISRGWVEQRIQGLSLGTALKNAFFKFMGNDIPTLADSFLYPALGIGRISDRLAQELEPTGTLHTSSPVVRVRHSSGRLLSVVVRRNVNNGGNGGGNGGDGEEREAEGFVSTLPLPLLVLMMDPPAPKAVREAAEALSFRDLIIAAVSVKQPYVTNQSWVYVPEVKFPFGRLHEPKVWSPHMAPEDSTLLVLEYFCFKGDALWQSPDSAIAGMSVKGLEELGFSKPSDVADIWIERIPRAYPLFEVGYEERCRVILDWLSGFENLCLAGRAGLFEYQNMDHAIVSGFGAAADAMKATA